MSALGDGAARLAGAARLDGRATLPVRANAIERLGDEAGGRCLANPAHAGEQESMGDSAALDGVGEGLHHRVLADQLVEGLRPILAGENAVGGRRPGWRGKFGQVEA